MIEILLLLLRIAGAGLVLLAAMHIVIGKRLQWADDCKRLTPVNESIFHVHTLFICLILVLMGLPSLLQPSVFVIPTPAGGWMAWSFAAFWLVRLYAQWFIYKPALWRGKRLETRVHWVFTFIWAALAGLFALCGAIQAGWI